MGQGPVIASIDSLPGRYVPDPAQPLDLRFRINVGRCSRDVVVTPQTCRVETPSGRPDAEICTSVPAWLEMDAGRLSGIEAFGEKKLTLRGSIQKALLFEPLFERPDGGGLRYSVERIMLGKVGLSTLVAGDPDAPPVVLVHGLGATKASMLPIVPHLARHHRVYALDLPGFGASSKPRGRYDARWFAGYVFAWMEELGLESAKFAGNSMGGRIIQEMAMTDAGAVEAIACLCPATAFSRRPALWLAKMLRPELGFAVNRIPRRRIISGLKDLFAEAERVHESWYEAATDDFLKTWKSPRARMAFFAAARQIYLEEPDGDAGFFSRLALLDVPAFYIYGRQDVLITPHFGHKIGDVLPAAQVEVWEDCGHAPQVEHPQRVADKLLGFFGSRSEDLAIAR